MTSMNMMRMMGDDENKDAQSGGGYGEDDGDDGNADDAGEADAVIRVAMWYLLGACRLAGRVPSGDVWVGAAPWAH